MSLSPGTRLGAYEILTLIGSGGMGEVYRARDRKLDREIAIKVLPEAVSSDPGLVARFTREAQVLAALNHPNIAHIHGYEDADGIHGLAMELVDGSTLAERVARGPMPLEEAMAIARQIAAALEAAHHRGIVHRDLKPANIKLTPQGTVKVLDFGLAKLVESGAAPAGVGDVSIGATTMFAGTHAGIVLGTPAYMSPEQARGEPVDRRTDIWAFGCIVFEMLSGRPAFSGTNPSDIIANVLRGTPDWSALPGNAQCLTPVLQQCLERDATRRLRDSSDVLLLLEDRKATASLQNAARGPRGVPWRAAAVAAAIGLVAGGLGVHLVRRAEGRSDVAQVARFELAASSSYPFAADAFGANVVISPDGSQIVYTSKHGAASQLVVRRLDQLEPTPLAGSEGGFDPFFSPDGRHVGFATFTELKQVPTTGGPSTTICTIDAYFSHAVWGPDNRIVFAQGALGLFRVSADGGTPQRIAAPDTGRQEQAYASPVLLPGGDALLYTAVLRDGSTRILARRLSAGDTKTVAEGGFGPHYLPTGHLIYGDGPRLMAVRFNPETLQISGSPAVVSDRVLTKLADRITDIAVADNGAVVYVAGTDSSGLGRLVWVDQTGTHIARIVDQALREPRFLRISPDGRRLSVVVGPGGQGQIWVYDLAATTPPLKLTFEDHNLFPVWSPDGKQLLFLRRAGSDQHLFTIAADGSAVQPTLFESDRVAPPAAWVHNGSLVVMESSEPSKLWLLARPGTTAKPWLDAPFAESGASVSADGGWLAYTSNQTGASEVWVRPFPGPGAPARVSSDGGYKPFWSRDGRKIYFENGGKLLAARVVSTAPEFRTETPEVLFDGGFVRDDADPHIRYMDVAADGRFVMVEPAERAGSNAIVVVQHWEEELKRLVPLN